jgi:hypothetical protein
MNRTILNAALISTAVIAGGLGGCVGYNVYPPEQGSGGFSDPSSPPVYQLMTEALKWAVKKYPPGSQLSPTMSDIPIAPSEAEASAAPTGVEAPRVAISLFSEMRPDVYEYAVRQIGQGAVPLTPETEHLPRYMVSRVWVGGDEAKVDVFRPVHAMGADGVQLYQPISVNLRGGMKYWRVTSYRVWSIGTMPPPEPQYLGGSVPMEELYPDAEPDPVPADVIMQPGGEAGVGPGTPGAMPPAGEAPDGGVPSDPA